MEIIKSYSYLDNIAKYLITEQNKLIFEEYNLSGARLSGKTTSITIAIAKIIAVSITYNKKVAIYSARKMTKSVPDLVEEIKIALDDFKIDYVFTGKSNKSSRPRFVFKNDSFIEVVGITKTDNSANLKGLSKCYNYDLSIDWVEEANECVKKDFQDLRFAIRGAKRHISITSCNPDLIFQDHIKYLNDNVSFDMNKLKAYGQQLTIWSKKTDRFMREGTMLSSVKKRVLNHYTTFKVNPHLSDAAIMLLEDLKDTDPQKAISWYYGCPGSLAGSVFGDYLPKTLEQISFVPYKYQAGLDLGFSEAIDAHPTTCQLVALDRDYNYIQVKEEFYHDNTLGIKLNINQIYTELIKKIRQWQIKYNLNDLTIYTDYGSGGIVSIEVLNNLASQLKVNANFVPVEKKVWLVKDRVEAVQMLMVSGQLAINKTITPNLYRQMSLMVYEDTTTTKNKEVKIVDLNDDCFDALTYALMPLLKLVLENNPLSKRRY